MQRVFWEAVADCFFFFGYYLEELHDSRSYKGSHKYLHDSDDSGMQAYELCVLGDIRVTFFHQSPFL